MKLKDLLVGKRVKATKDCSGAKAGEIYEVEYIVDNLYLKGTDCCCFLTWELIDPIAFTPEPHKHKPRVICADCKEEIK